MKSEEQIKARLATIEKRLAIVDKHHDKYVELYDKASNSCIYKDVTCSRLHRYKSKYMALYDRWRELSYCKVALRWVLDNEGEHKDGI